MIYLITEDWFIYSVCTLVLFFMFWALIAWLSPVWAAFWIVVIFAGLTFKQQPL